MIPAMKKNLGELRKEIDKIDATIIKALAKRQRIAHCIGQYKAKSSLKITNKKRELALMRRYKKLSEQYQLRTTYIISLFKKIIFESKRVQ